MFHLATPALLRLTIADCGVGSVPFIEYAVSVTSFGAIPVLIAALGMGATYAIPGLRYKRVWLSATIVLIVILMAEVTTIALTARPASAPCQL